MLFSANFTDNYLILVSAAYVLAANLPTEDFLMNAKSSDQTFHQIYNKLLAGKKLEIRFPSAAESERFRVRMHQYKKMQEKEQLNIGIIAEEDIPVFSVSCRPDSYGYCLAISFRTRKAAQTFTVIEEADDTC